MADSSRTDKTICLAVSPSLKSFGIPGRARLFEVRERVRQVNAQRRDKAPGRVFKGKSCDIRQLEADPSLELDFVIATPQMARYMQVSSQVYSTYLKYIAPEDIHVYSIDEVFIDATHYLGSLGMTGHELAMKMIRDVLSVTGITATAGIGTNLYLAKVAMDIVAKHIPADADGVRIAELDMISYREQLWEHEPLKDFWRVGRGIAARLEAVGIKTMGELALRSMSPQWEEYLYKQFGVNAELLIDHAWGWEPCPMSAIKAYRPSTNSLSSGQVLSIPYTFSKARTVVLEMMDSLVLELVDKGLVTDQIVLDVNYDTENMEQYAGETVVDYYGRLAPKPAHGSTNLGMHTSSTTVAMEAVAKLYDEIMDRKLTIRRITLTVNHVVREDSVGPVQMNLFDEPADNSRERRRQEAILEIRKKFGKNSILKGMNFDEGATARDRNNQIGGHKA